MNSTTPALLAVSIGRLRRFRAAPGAAAILKLLQPPQEAVLGDPVHRQPQMAAPRHHILARRTAEWAARFCNRYSTAEGEAK